MNKPKKITTEEFDRLFDEGDDCIDEYIDWSSGFHPNRIKRVNVDMTQEMIRKLDARAKRRGVTRQALIKMWLADRLEATS